MSLRRWQRAQKKENMIYRATPSIDDDSLNEKTRLTLLKEFLEFTQTKSNDLKMKVILEIGGYYYADIALAGSHARCRIALDPLILEWKEKKGDCEYICGIAENIPLTDQSIDLCIFRNTIDHTLSPQFSLLEIKRVLKKPGKLHISCNVFHPWVRFLFPIFNALDTPHPHHFTESSLIELLQKNGFFNDTRFPAQECKERNFKAFVGRLFGVKTISFLCSINK